jgi:selenide, water dikinase
VLRLSDDVALVQTVDFFAPVVDDPFEFGAIAAANSMSDVFAMGGTVTIGLNIAAFPDDLDLDILAEIFRGGSEKMIEAGGIIAGGHTVTDSEPKYGIAVTGMVSPERLWTKAGARPGDQLFLTKPIGSGVLTTAAKQQLIGRDELQEAIDQMMRLNLYARNIASQHAVHAATDITGYGLAGHAWEMSNRSGVRLNIALASVPLLERAGELVARGVAAGGLHRNRQHYTGLEDGVHFDAGPTDSGALLVFDPQTSGGLLVCVPNAEAGAFADAFSDLGEQLWHIGEVTTGRGVTFTATDTRG